MNRNDLIRHLEEYLNTPQRSERWAMYRLVAPVVDLANSTLGMCPYFEFNQTSKHGTSQSVDIALIEGDQPHVMIEVKRIDRRISAEQIDKYLKPGVRGLVTNGISWVLCVNGKNTTLTLCSTDNRTISRTVLNAIVAFIRGRKLRDAGWSKETSYIDPVIKPGKHKKDTRARRRSNPIEISTDLTTLRRRIEKLSEASTLDQVLLHSVLDQFEREGGMRAGLRCETRKSRVGFFDDQRRTRSGRLARIELGKRQPDVLVLTELVDIGRRLQEMAPAAPHDKGPHMRRFRLNDEAQAERFGTELARLLNEQQS